MGEFDELSLLEVQQQNPKRTCDLEGRRKRNVCVNVLIEPSVIYVVFFVHSCPRSRRVEKRF